MKIPIILTAILLASVITNSKASQVQKNPGIGLRFNQNFFNFLDNTLFKEAESVVNSHQHLLPKNFSIGSLNLSNLKVSNISVDTSKSTIYMEPDEKSVFIAIPTIIQ